MSYDSLMKFAIDSVTFMIALERNCGKNNCRGSRYNNLFYVQYLSRDSTRVSI